MGVQANSRVPFAEEKYTKIFLEDFYSDERRVRADKPLANKVYLAFERTQQGLLMEGVDIKPQCNRTRSLMDVVSRLVCFICCHSDKLARTNGSTRKPLHPLQSAVYHLAASSSSSRAEGSLVTSGTAVYLGDGLFLTAGHCCQKKESYDQMV
jgi:hypothetical protein